MSEVWINPMADFLDENFNVVHTLAALLKHVAVHNERNLAKGVPQMPLSIVEYEDTGNFGIVFGDTGMQEMNFSQTWGAVNDLALGWRVGYVMGRVAE